MTDTYVVQEKQDWHEVKSRKKRGVVRFPVKPCKFDEKCRKGRFCAYTHTRWSWRKMTKKTKDNNDSDISQLASTDMSKPGEQKLIKAASDVMEQLCELYPEDQNLSSLTNAHSPVYKKEEIGVVLKMVSTILNELTDKEIAKVLQEAQVSLTCTS